MNNNIIEDKSNYYKKRVLFFNVMLILLTVLIFVISILAINFGEAVSEGNQETVDSCETFGNSLGFIISLILIFYPVCILNVIWGLIATAIIKRNYKAPRLWFYIISTIFKLAATLGLGYNCYAWYIYFEFGDLYYSIIMFIMSLITVGIFVTTIVYEIKYYIKTNFKNEKTTS